MSDIDGLATYPELPATGHAEVDGISIVSVNCMMAMLKLPNLTWHIQVGTTNIGGAVQQAVNALLAGVCNYAVVWRAMHNPRGTYQNLPSGMAAGAAQFTAPYGFGGPGQGMAVAYTRWLERNNQNREKMATLAVTQRKHAQHNPHAYFYGTPLSREDYLASRMVALSVLSVRLRHSGAGSGRDRLDDGGTRPRPEAGARLPRRLWPAAPLRGGRPHRQPVELHGGRQLFGEADLGTLRFFARGRRRRADLRRFFRVGDLRPGDPTGSARRGKHLDFIQDGRIELDGDLPLNTFGGSLGTGRIHGLWHIIEGALQASGRAGSRQVKDANVSFVGASALIVTGTTFIFVHGEGLY